MEEVRWVLSALLWHRGRKGIMVFWIWGDCCDPSAFNFISIEIRVFTLGGKGSIKEATAIKRRRTVTNERKLERIRLFMVSSSTSRIW